MHGAVLGIIIPYLTCQHPEMVSLRLSPSELCPENNVAGEVWSQRGQGPPRNDILPVECVGTCKDTMLYNFSAITKG